MGWRGKVGRLRLKDSASGRSILLSRFHGRAGLNWSFDTLAAALCKHSTVPSSEHPVSMKSDPLHGMLADELGRAEIAELRRYLDGEFESFEMGYGDLTIEPYDALAGRSRVFRVRHPRFGEEMVHHAALLAALHDLEHELLRKEVGRRA